MGVVCRVESTALRDPATGRALASLVDVLRPAVGLQHPQLRGNGEGPRTSRSARAVPNGALSVSVFSGQQRPRRAHHDVEIEQHRPILNVIKVVLNAALDLLMRVGFAT